MTSFQNCSSQDLPVMNTTVLAALQGAQKSRGTRETSPALQLLCAMPTQALMSRARETGRRDRKDLPHIRTELCLTIQVKFLSLFMVKF
jgi:hypothetical protein